jgi:hypothetical protein
MAIAAMAGRFAALATQHDFDNVPKREAPIWEVSNRALGGYALPLQSLGSPVMIAPHGRHFRQVPAPLLLANPVSE